MDADQLIEKAIDSLVKAKNLCNECDLLPDECPQIYEFINDALSDLEEYLYYMNEVPF